MQSNPVVSPPAKHAAHWPQCKHAEKAVIRSQFGWLELDGSAMRARSSDPEQPESATPVRITHLPFPLDSRQCELADSTFFWTRVGV